MLARIRRLERILAPQLAQLIVQEHTEKLFVQWHRATDRGLPLPDPFTFIGGIIKAGYWMRRSGGVHNYLDNCVRNKTLPDARVIFQVLLPWRYPRFPKLPGRA